jgi:MoxR-like ATPase
LHSQQVDINAQLKHSVQQITDAEEIMATIQSNAKVRIEPKLLNYINKIVRSTRSWPTFHLGASPRAGISLMQGARTLAAFRGRSYAVPDDVVEIAVPALRHRVIMTAEAEVEGHSTDSELKQLLKSIDVPRS